MSSVSFLVVCLPSSIFMYEREARSSMGCKVSERVFESVREISSGCVGAAMCAHQCVSVFFSICSVLW